MPYLHNLNRCSFSLDQQTQLILELFKKACDQYLKNKNLEERINLDLVINDKQLKKGIYPKILNFFENFNEKKYGASFVTLNQIDNVKLDPKADKMLDYYTNKLNAIYTLNGMTSEQLNQEENITSAALVFRKLLFRLVTIALCNENIDARDGETLLKIYSYFVDQVLCNIDKFYREETIFSYFASKEHIESINDVGQVVLAVKLMHSHKDNITECLTKLKSLTHNIEAMILAHLYLADSRCSWSNYPWSYRPHISKSDLTDHSIESKLNEYERYLEQKNENKSSDGINRTVKTIGITTYAAIEHLGRAGRSKSILLAKDISENSHIGALIACKNNHCPEVLYQKIELLYSLYFKSRCLLISLEQIDELITACSWVPIVMGIIDLRQICQLMRKHCEICAETLSISNNDILTKLPFRQAILHKAFNIQSQIKDMHSKIIALEELQNPVTIKKIKYQINDTLRNIGHIQDALEISLLEYNKMQNEDKKNNRLSLFSHADEEVELLVRNDNGFSKNLASRIL